jgi:hypothetical protein
VLLQVCLQFLQWQQQQLVPVLTCAQLLVQLEVIGILTQREVGLGCRRDRDSGEKTMQGESNR